MCYFLMEESQKVIRRLCYMTRKMSDKKSCKKR